MRCDELPKTRYRGVLYDSGFPQDIFQLYTFSIFNFVIVKVLTQQAKGAGAPVAYCSRESIDSWQEACFKKALISICDLMKVK